MLGNCAKAWVQKQDLIMCLRSLIVYQGDMTRKSHCSVGNCDSGIHGNMVIGLRERESLTQSWGSNVLAPLISYFIHHSFDYLLY